jgi:hypothetical protein
MRLGDGDALSVQGAFRAETYEKDSVAKLSLSIVADRVLALRQPGKKPMLASSRGREHTSMKMSAPLIRSFRKAGVAMTENTVANLDIGFKKASPAIRPGSQRARGTRRRCSPNRRAQRRYGGGKDHPLARALP